MPPERETLSGDFTVIEKSDWKIHRGSYTLKYQEWNTHVWCHAAYSWVEKKYNSKSNPSLHILYTEAGELP